MSILLISFKFHIKTQTINKIQKQWTNCQCQISVKNVQLISTNFIINLTLFIINYLQHSKMEKQISNKGKQELELNIQVVRDFNQEVTTCSYAKIVKGYNKNNKNQRFCIKTVQKGDSSALELLEHERQTLLMLGQHDHLIYCLPHRYIQENSQSLVFQSWQNSLFTQSKTEFYSNQKIISIFKQLISAYKVVFDKKILHQNISPVNIFVKDGRYKLGGFQYAIFYKNYIFGDQRDGQLRYMSPQKLLSQNYKGDPKSDVYSLGIVMWELITKKHPYIPENLVYCDGSQQYKRKLTQILNDPKEAALNFPSSESIVFSKLLEIINRMVCKSPQRRISFQEIQNFICENKKILLSKNQGKNLGLNQKPIQTKQPQKHNFKFVVSIIEKDLVLVNQARLRIQSHIKKIKEIVVFLLDLMKKVNLKQERSLDQTQINLVAHVLFFCKSLIQNLLQEMRSPIMFQKQEWEVFEQPSDKNLIKQVIQLSYQIDVMENYLIKKQEFREVLANVTVQYSQNPVSIRIKILLQVLGKFLTSITQWIQVKDWQKLALIIHTIVSTKLVQTFRTSDQSTRQSIISECQQKSVEDAIQFVAYECQKRKIYCLFNQQAS